MADRGGQGPGSQDRQGGSGPPPRRRPPRRYDYGVPNDDDYGWSHGYEDSRTQDLGRGRDFTSRDLNGGPHSAAPQYGGAAGNGVSGAGENGGYTGGYGYTEPFDYSGRGTGAAGPTQYVPPGSDDGPPRGQVPPVAGAPGAPVGPGAVGPVGPSGPGVPAADGETMRLGAAVGRETEPPPDGPGRGRAERRRAAKRIKRRRRLSATKEIPILIGVALAIALILKTFFVQAFVIPSGSMEQTIKIGDRVLVDRLTPWFGTKPERGDVVVFKDPGGWLDKGTTKKEDPPFGLKQGKDLLTFIGLLPSDDEQDLIKRAVAVGGDTVECCDEQDRVTVNGTPLNEPYLHPGNKPSQMEFKVTVPIGRLFVMGDHRSNSADSRFHLDDPGRGTVPEELVLGRAMVIAWPFDHWRQLEEPKTYASVPDPGGAPSSAANDGDNRVAQLPIPGELPLVMGVVGLSRYSGGPWSSVRSERGGRGGRRPIRFRQWRRRRRAS